MAITSQPQLAGFPLTYLLTGSNLPKQTWVKISQIRTVPVERLGKRIGRVEGEEIAGIIEGLLELIT